MHVRFVLSLGLAIIGAALVGAAVTVSPAAGGAAASGDRTLRLNVSDTSVEYIDPALNYDFIGWRLEAMTCARLLSYPDRSGAAASRLYPEVARGMPSVSGNGLTYTFRIRPGFRFSDGSAVTASSFRRAIERALSPEMQSPASSFAGDIVGAAAVLKGKGSTPSGVKVVGDRLSITLTKRAPDFLSRIAMPFFCAVPESLPIDSRGVTEVPGAGPYYVAEFKRNASILLRKNPYYGGARPQRWDEVKVTQNISAQTSYLQVKRGEIDLDLAGLPPTAHGELTKQYGLNQGRYFVLPGLVIQYLAMNTERPVFRDRSLRQAVAYAIDRTQLMRLGGLNGGVPNDQILPPGLLGYRPITVYPNRPDLAKAKALMRGREVDVVLYSSNDPTSKSQSELIRANLGRIGIRVDVKLYSFSVVINKAGTRGEPFDMFLIGWFADYPDPYDFINVLLYGKTIRKSNNINAAYFNDPVFNRRMERAALTTGDARAATYAALDRDLTREAPFVVYGNATTREFISAKVGCVVRSAPVGGINLTMLCRK